MGLENFFDFTNKKVWIAGHKGMLGSRLQKKLSINNVNLIECSRGEVDLTNQKAVFNWIKNNKPDIIFIAAEKVGGIKANSEFPGDFIYQNLMIQSNIIHSAYLNSIPRLVFFGSSCTYPKESKQPINESELLTGMPEVTNLQYAVAKISGIKMIEAYQKQYNCNYISIMPANSYGPGDNFNLNDGHVIPSMIRKFHEAKVNRDRRVTFWGSGTPLREFLFIDDLADASMFLAKHYNEHNHINVGTGDEISIRELAILISKVIGYEGNIEFDKSRPDGMKRKVLDSTKILKMGWRPSTLLEDGVELTYKWFLDNSKIMRL